MLARATEPEDSVLGASNADLAISKLESVAIMPSCAARPKPRRNADLEPSKLELSKLEPSKLDASKLDASSDADLDTKIGGET